MRALLAHTKLTRPEVDAYIPHNTIYADDVDFISKLAPFLDNIITHAVPIFKDFSLLVNDDKTERTVIGHRDLVIDQDAWRKTKKLGSLLGVDEDVDRRIKLANLP